MTTPDLRAALREAYGLLARLDRQAVNPSHDRLVKVTVESWRDGIRPVIARISAVLATDTAPRTEYNDPIAFAAKSWKAKYETERALRLAAEPAPLDVERLCTCGKTWDWCTTPTMTTPDPHEPWCARDHFDADPCEEGRMLTTPDLRAALERLADALDWRHKDYDKMVSDLTILRVALDADPAAEHDRQASQGNHLFDESCPMCAADTAPPSEPHESLLRALTALFYVADLDPPVNFLTEWLPRIQRAALADNTTCICGGPPHKGDCHFGWHNNECKMKG